MKASFYAGVSGLAACQQSMNTVGNNLANVNTAGYQKETVAFEDLLRTGMYVNAGSEPLTGSGTRVLSTGIQAGQGDLQRTDRNLDFAIQGEGFFAVEQDGGTVYTRNGAFSLTVDEDERAYLCTAGGLRVLDQDGERIRVRRRDDGSVDTEDLRERIGIFRFSNPNGLVPLAGSTYGSSPLSGEPRGSDRENTDVLFGWLERSGATMIEGMLDMVAAQRAYQLCARVVQTSDELEQIVSGLRR